MGALERQRIERVGAHAKEDWAIRMAAIGIRDGLSHFVSKSKLPYFKAALDAVERFPEKFRQNGYDFSEVEFANHKRTKSGRLMCCDAEFLEERPHRLARLSRLANKATEGSYQT